jgi:hypothetical protein
MKNNSKARLALKSDGKTLHFVAMELQKKFRNGKEMTPVGFEPTPEDNGLNVAP